MTMLRDKNHGPLTQQPWWLSLFVIALVLRAMLSMSYHAAINPNSGVTGIDFSVYFLAAARLNHGQRLYIPDAAKPDGDFYVYTPLPALLVRPLAHLPFQTALKLWFAASMAGLILGSAFFAVQANVSFRNAAVIILLLVTVTRFWPILIDQAFANIDSVIFPFLCAMYLAIRRNSILGLALLIAAAALFKTWLLGCVVYLVLRRAWPAVAVCISAFLVANLLMFGPLQAGEWHDFLHVTHAMSVQPIVLSQSLPSFAAMHFQPGRVIQPLLESKLLYLAFAGIGCALVGAGLLRLWMFGSELTPSQELLRFGLTLDAILLMLPVCHAAYFIYDLPMLWILMLSRGERWRNWIGISSAAIYILAGMTWPVVPPISDAYQSGLPSLVTSAHLYFRLILWCLGFSALFLETGRSVVRLPAALARGARGFRGRQPVPATLSGMN